MISPPLILNVPSVKVLPSTVPENVPSTAEKLPLNVTLSSRSIVTVSLLTLVVMFVPPATVAVSAPSIWLLPVSPARVQNVEILTLLAAVKRPCESTVNVGISVALPYVPAVTDVLSRSIVPLVYVKPTPPTRYASIALFALVVVKYKLVLPSVKLSVV